MSPKKQSCSCIHESWTSSLWSTTWVQWGLEVTTLWPPWAGANLQLKLWQFGICYPCTWGDWWWLIGRLPWGKAILPPLQTSQCLCTLLDQGQRETCSLTSYKSAGGSRHDRCGKSEVCVPSMQPFRINLFLQKQSRSSRVQPSRNVCCHAQHIIFKSQQQDNHNGRASLFQRVATSISNSISISTNFKHWS